MPNVTRLANLSGAPHQKRFFSRIILPFLQSLINASWHKYLSVSLCLYDYTVAKILIINEISNYFMLTLLKGRVIIRCFAIKDRVIIGCFVIKDRVIKPIFYSISSILVAVPQSGHKKWLLIIYIFKSTILR